jgi:hypothetical protein
MENNRPKLTDPAEFALMRSIYFKDRPSNEEVDPIERLERMESKARHNNKSSR